MKRLYILLLATLFCAGLSQAQPAIGSTMPQVGTSFKTVTGSDINLPTLFGSKGTVLIFWGNECPWVGKAEDRVKGLASSYSSKGVGFILVNSNDPVAFPRENASEGAAKGYTIPYILDPGASLARALGATRMPQVFVFDAERKLVYTGALDDSPGDPSGVTRRYADQVLQRLTSGSGTYPEPTKAFGCTLKY